MTKNSTKLVNDVLKGLTTGIKRGARVGKGFSRRCNFRKLNNGHIEAIRKMVADGFSAEEIVTKLKEEMSLKTSIATVYNVKYGIPPYFDKADSKDAILGWLVKGMACSTARDTGDGILGDKPHHAAAVLIEGLMRQRIEDGIIGQGKAEYFLKTRVWIQNKNCTCFKGE